MHFNFKFTKQMPRKVLMEFYVVFSVYVFIKVWKQTFTNLSDF